VTTIMTVHLPAAPQPKIRAARTRGHRDRPAPLRLQERKGNSGD
jgi:hypothetical protein